MAIRKYNKEEPLDQLIGIRVSTRCLNRLEELRKESNCQSLGEFARKILQKEQILWYHKDAAMDHVAAELAGIRMELKAIGTNINQVTRYFNSTSVPNQKIYEALKILDEYKKLTAPCDKVLNAIANIKWSPK